MKTIFEKVFIFILCLLFISGDFAFAEAPASSAGEFAIENYIMNEGATWMFGPSHNIARSNIGESIVGVVFSSNPNPPRYGLFQGFLFVNLYEPPLPDYQYDIREIIARKVPDGDLIYEKTWQSDSTPFFTWELKAPSLVDVVGYSIAFDEYPDDIADVIVPEYQTPEFFLADGKHTFYAVAKNTAGNFGSVGLFEVWVDKETPEILNAFPENNTIVSDPRVQIGGRLFDATSGIDIASIRFKIIDSLNDEYLGAGDYDPETGIVVFTPEFDFAEGDIIVRMDVSDNAGNSAETLLWSFKIDTTSPLGGILINNGEPTTLSPDVELKIFASEFGSGVTQMNISNNGIFNVNDWQAYNPLNPGEPVIKNWTLDLSEGQKTVYVKFRDAALNETPLPETDTIFLVLTVPNTFITKAPQSLTSQKDANFSFTATISNCLFKYKLDNNPWSSFSGDTDVFFSDLSDGNHYFQVKAGIDLDADGTIEENETDASPAGASWNVGDLAAVSFEPKQPIRYYKKE